MKKKASMKLSPEEKVQVQTIFQTITNTSPLVVLTIHSLLEDTMKYLNPMLTKIYGDEFNRLKKLQDKT